MDEEGERGTLSLGALVDAFAVLALTMAVIMMVPAVAVMVWAGVEIFKCCRRRQRVRLEI